MPVRFLARCTRIILASAGSAILGLALLAGAGCSPEPERPNVILIVLDTVRSDHLGCYGYGRDTSPHMDRFAKEDGILFEAAYAQAPLTLPSHMSMLTGLYPETHGVLLPKVKEVKHGGTDKLSEDVVTLAEAIKKRGFRTSAFTDGLRFIFGGESDVSESERATQFLDLFIAEWNARNQDAVFDMVLPDGVFVTTSGRELAGEDLVDAWTRFMTVISMERTGDAVDNGDGSYSFNVEFSSSKMVLTITLEGDELVSMVEDSGVIG